MQVAERKDEWVVTYAEGETDGSDEGRCMGIKRFGGRSSVKSRHRVGRALPLLSTTRIYRYTYLFVPARNKDVERTLVLCYERPRTDFRSNVFCVGNRADN